MRKKKNISSRLNSQFKNSAYLRTKKQRNKLIEEILVTSPKVKEKMIAFPKSKRSESEPLIPLRDSYKKLPEFKSDLKKVNLSEILPKKEKPQFPKIEKKRREIKDFILKTSPKQEKNINYVHNLVPIERTPPLPKKRSSNLNIYNQDVLDQLDELFGPGFTSNSPSISRKKQKNKIIEKKKVMKNKVTRKTNLEPLFNFKKKNIRLLNDKSKKVKIKWFGQSKDFLKITKILKIGNLLGTGAYAAVFEGLFKPNNELVAVKIFDKNAALDTTKRALIQKEANFLYNMNHPRILKLNYLLEDETKVYFVMEHWGNQTLEKFLEKEEISKKEKKKIFLQILQGVAYLHSNNIYHRDLKLSNIMIKHGSICILDFGLASDSTLEYEYVNCGTPSYMPPEMANTRGYLGGPADIWTLGIIWYKILTGNFPFNGSNSKDLKEAICKCQLPDHPSLSSADFKFVRKMLHQNPAKRAKIKEVNIFCKI